MIVGRMGGAGVELAWIAGSGVLVGNEAGEVANDRRGCAGCEFGKGVRGVGVLIKKRNGVLVGVTVKVRVTVGVALGISEGVGVGPIGVGNGPRSAFSVNAIAVRVLLASFCAPGSNAEPLAEFHSIRSKPINTPQAIIACK
jgi:hypothetical protein